MQARTHAKLECWNDLGSVHETVPDMDSPAIPAELFADDPILKSHPRYRLELNGQEHIVFMQHVIVLEAV